MAKAPPGLPGRSAAESPLDRALTLALAGERDSALRWAAAIVFAEPEVPSGLLLTGRLLAEFGRQEAAREALEVCIARGIETSQLPLAVAACSDLRALGGNANRHFDAIADAFAKDSPSLGEGHMHPPKLPTAEEVRPLASVLTGPALLGKAAEAVHLARRKLEDEQAQADPPPPIVPQPLFSALERSALRALIEVFEVTTVPQDTVIIEEGTSGAEAYIVARGELEARRSPQVRPRDPDRQSDPGRPSDPGTPVVLARLTGGALFGEMSLLSRAPRAASVVACRPSILLVARKDMLDAVAEREPQVAVELAAHCRRRMVQNLVRTSAILSAVRPEDRPALVENFETKVYEKGDRLISEGQEDAGLHLVASGEVAVVRVEAGEPFVIATLGPGEVVGEVALVLRRPSAADVMAVHPTVTLHLSSNKFMSLVKAHPAILAELYQLAVRRDDETHTIVEQETTSASADDYVLI